jgi:DNA-directed RNA polymerase subunit beta'
LITNTDFDAIRISLASPEMIKQWSYGEVTKPETINYRTQKPERGGLFCEKIFGPVKDWECSCGKYKKVRYKGIICDKCGVEVTRSIVRRERMGHIELAAPVVHVWFVRGTPNYLALLLDVTPRKLERVIYYAQYMVTSINEDRRKQAMTDLDKELAEIHEKKQVDLVARQKEIDVEYENDMKQLETEAPAHPEGETDKEKRTADKLQNDHRQQYEKAYQQKSKRLKREIDKEEKEETKEVMSQKAKLESIRLMQTFSEQQYYQMKDEFGSIFEAQMGAEAVLKVLGYLNLAEIQKEMRQSIKTTGSKQKKKKAVKRLRILDALMVSGNDPAWMIMRSLPVIPPDLRPMVQLDGGRFAASDLNDLYRRVINRNNRLRRLMELEAPEVIMRNEKRMLQEAVDALIDNSAHGERVISRRNRKLKSLSDILKGKQGRFRQNLLGKRVDYSGRSVIVVGPALRLQECGLPKKMALELFRPFILRELLARDFVHTIKAANRMIERAQPEVWDVLDEIIKGYPVLLNRAPTLHRLGIQAFYPVLVEGDAIQLHPLVCTAFNADFDGDQMAVHVPLSAAAKAEAREYMLSAKNLLLPASGKAAVGPTRDMLLGCYYMTLLLAGAKGTGMVFSTPEESLIAYNTGTVELNAAVKIRMHDDEKPLDTSVGRILFNQIVPPEFGYQNDVMTKKTLGKLIERSYEELGVDPTAKLVDDIKNTGFHYSTVCAATIAVDDIIIPKNKPEILVEADKKAELIHEQFDAGLITETESYEHTVNLWIKTTEQITESMMKQMDPLSPDFDDDQFGSKR